MHESERSNQPSGITRRSFLLTAVTAAVSPFLWKAAGKSETMDSTSKAQSQVTVVLFSDAGERIKKVQIPRVVKTEEEWRKQLSRRAFDITRHADTEIAFSGKFWNLHERGIYRCICCDNALFSSRTKYDSGTGWPSFWAPIAAENVQTMNDASLGMERTAVSCTKCDAHLGHVFGDGPAPTHLRYCINSESLRFVPGKGN